MFKKLMVMAVLFTAITCLSFSETKADNSGGGTEVAITWSEYNFYSSYYSIRVEVDFTTTAHSFNIEFPNSDYHLLTNEPANLDSQISFYGEDDLLSKTSTWEEVFGNEIAGFFDFEFSKLMNEPCGKIVIDIQQSWSIVPGGYLDYMNNGSTAYRFTTSPTYRQHYFTRYFPNWSVIGANDYTIQSGSYTMLLDLSTLSGEYLKKNDIANSYISVINETQTTTDYFYLKDFTLVNNDIYLLDLTSVGFTSTDVGKYNIFIVAKEDNMTQLDLFNRGTEITFNEDITQVEFVSDGEVIDTQIVRTGNMPVLPPDPTPDEGLEFYAWQYEDGSIFNEYAIPTAYIKDDVVKIYANFVYEGTVIPFEDVDPTPTASNLFTFFDGIGFNTTTSRTILYLGISLLLIIGLIKIKLDGFVIIITVALVTFFFNYMGFLPVIVYSTAYVILAFSFVTQLRKVV